MALSATENQLKTEIISKLQRHFGRSLEDATPMMLYKACALTVRDRIMEQWTVSHNLVKKEKSKKLYYMSLEFLMGRSLSTNILNLMMTEEYRNVMDDIGIGLPKIEEQENDAGLGNGGLGRLAACFLDSLTTMNLPAYGCSIRYEYGLFRQRIVDGYQVEMPDPWLEDGNIWEVAIPEEQVEVKFGGTVHTINDNGRFSFVYENSHTVLAVPYDVPLCGYDSSVINKLRLWSARSPKHLDMGMFNHGDYVRAVEEKEMAAMISNVLYPEDNHTQGRTLRLRQQYFLVAATVRWIMNEFKKRYGENWSKLPEKAAIQLNDTHPTLAIPEMMRILMDEEGLGWDEAWEVVTHVFAYTNHSVLQEAMEKWPAGIMQPLLPRIYMIIEEINKRLLERLGGIYPNDPLKWEYMAILQQGDMVNMTNLCMAACFAVNGVSALHTRILTTQTFADYYRIDPARFHAITNGVTFRRWIVDADPALTKLICDKIGNEWIKDSEKLAQIREYCDDKEFVREFAKIKYGNKVALAKYIKEHNDIDVDPRSIYDVQIKRLHEYKRQLLNVLHIMYLYNNLCDNPDMEFQPRTFIFGAKAAPGYTRAKLIIKLINSVAELVNHDERVGGRIKVVFIENYGVSLAEKIVAAADVSEQISTAGKEASGTGNMKMMLNGALTLGTLDGANIEILEQVGAENIYIFGLKMEEVNARYSLGDDVHKIYASNMHLRRILEQLIDGSIEPDKPQLFSDIYHSLLFGDYGIPDPYMVLRDFDAYVSAQEQIAKDFKDTAKWWRMSIMNTASAGFFSSDRTIKQYNDEIWHLKPI